MLAAADVGEHEAEERQGQKDVEEVEHGDNVLPEVLRESQNGLKTYQEVAKMRGCSGQDSNLRSWSSGVIFTLRYLVERQHIRQ